MIRNSIITILLLFMATNLYAGYTGSSPNWETTADYASVSACVAAASPGDTITVTGDATWSETLEITRGINLIGSGNPVISGGLNLIYWVPNAAARSAHDTLTISGFTFDGVNGSWNTGLIRVSNDSAVDHVFLNVNKNVLCNADARGIYSWGAVWGVAHSNVFDRIASVFSAFGGDFDAWNSLSQAYGTAENFYFEDNLIRFSSAWPSGYSGWTQTGQGGRAVVRYNTWDYTNAAAPGEFWDIHGLQSPPGGGTTGCENYSSMVNEYYGNKIVNQVNAYRWMAHRGGWLMSFLNTLSGNTSPYNGLTQYYCNSCQAQGSFNQKATNSYMWINLTNGSEKPYMVYSPGDPPYGCEEDPIVENVDFFNYKADFDGTEGVGYGTLANRPSTCTTGVGYWATDQDYSDISDMVGKDHTVNITGKFYKCTSTNTWTEYYEPYTYPHPMRGMTSLHPSAPTNLRIVVQ